MPFEPFVAQEIDFNEKIFRVAPHPSAVDTPYGQEGRAAIVYKLDSIDESLALKVFKPRFCTPNLTSIANRTLSCASIPGLAVCRRTVLTPQRQARLLRQFPDLTYAVLMPWIEGPTWMQVLLEKTAFTSQQALFLAQSFAQILSEMEQQGIAHGDLSAPNLILPFLSSSEQSKSYAPVELVDVEQMYAKNLERPETIPSGSEGYAHPTVRKEKIWNDRVDRFAGAILLAEMLGWCDRQVRSAAWGECYFDPRELQNSNSHRYRLLRDSLLGHWGTGVVAILDRAWNSDLLEDCPTFGSWLISLPETVPSTPIMIGTKATHQNAETQPRPPCDDIVVTTLIHLGDQMASQGNGTGALETFQKAYNLVSSSSETARIILEKIQSLKTNQVSDEARTDIHQDKPGRKCPRCGKLNPADVFICVFCEHNITETPKTEQDIRSPNWALQIIKRISNLIPYQHNNIIVFQLLTVLGMVGIVVFAVLFIRESGVSSTSKIPSIYSPSIYFVSNRDGKDEIYRFEGSMTVRVTNTVGARESWEPYYTPFSALYFTSNRDGKREIYRLEGSETVRVTNSPNNTENWDPFFIQEGDLYFTSNRDGKREIYRLEGSNAIRVTNSPNNTESWDPFFTPSSSLYFTSNRDGKQEIYRLEGDKTVRVTNSPGNGESWDPFLTSTNDLYFTSNRDGQNEIYRFEGDETTRVTNSPNGYGSWYPFFR